MILAFFQIDWTLHLGDIVNFVIGSIITLIGWGIRRGYKEIKAFFETIGSFDNRIEGTAAVVDIHSDALEKAGWLRQPVPRVSTKGRGNEKTAGHSFV